MLYYTFNISLSSPIERGDSEKLEKESFDQRICHDVIALNEKQDYNVRFYVCDVRDAEMNLVGIIGYKSTKDPKALALQFVKDLGFDPSDITYNEITSSDLRTQLRKASRNDFIFDNDEIEIDLCLPSDTRKAKTRSYESIAEGDLSEEEILSRCASIALGADLRKEIERIFSKRNDSFIGHPVHYAFISDDLDDAEKAIDLLVSALHKAGRLRSRRIAVLKPARRFGIRATDKPTLDIGEINNYYITIRGGTIVLVPTELDYESETADRGMCNVDDIASELIEHRRECLTILVFGKNNVRSLDKLKSCLGNVRIIDIKEIPFETEAAKEMLKSKAQEDNLDSISSLMEIIDKGGDRTYYPADINNIYNDWLDNHLCDEFFSQYRDVESCTSFTPVIKGDAFKDLNELIGLKHAKRIVKQAIDFNSFQVKYHAEIKQEEKPSRHMVFTGNPGTAKTTVARLFAQIMKDNHVLSRGSLIEVGRKDLVGKYVGWTARLVEEAFNNARGSVLFIDEAYSLVDDKAGMYGDEAINTIVQMMENRRDDTIVIFAGYPDKMQAFLERNPGLRSRIAFHVDFDDYNEDELVDILRLMANKVSVTLDADVEPRVREIIRRGIGLKDFGNGRFVRNIFEGARMAQASRIMGMDENEVDSDIVNTLVAEDFMEPDEIREKNQFRRIGFAS